MQELIIIFIIAIATIATTYIAALLGVALTECFMLLNGIPDWTWTVVLVALILTVMRGMRYSLE